MKAWLRSLLLASGIALSLSSSALAQVLTLTITSPTHESSVASGAPVTLTAHAAGTVAAGEPKTVFYVNGASVSASIINDALGDASTIWTPPQPGVYFITAKVTDKFGNSATALAVRLFATGTVISSPLSNTLVPVGSSVVIKADATPAAGFVKQIEFFADGVSLGADSTYPYSIIYTPAGPAGTVHNITAQATDNTNAKLAVSAAVSVSMEQPIGSLPSCTVVSPTDGSKLSIPNYSISATANIPIEVTASDSDGQISKVDIYVDGVLMATDTLFPYSYSWQPPSVGTYKVVALAYDDKNNVIKSAENTVVVTAPPTVSITYPSLNATLTADTSVTINANASDSDGSVVSVQFFVDDVFVGQDTVAPYTASWTPVMKKDGEQTIIKALATDNFGITTVSATVAVYVTGGGGSGGVTTVVGIPPTVTLTSPKVAGTEYIVNAPAVLEATASDSDGTVQSVQFFVNGMSVGTDSTYPYSVSWTPVGLGTNYVITAKAVDNDGNAVVSPALTVKVIDPGPGLPTVSIAEPTAGVSIPVGVAKKIIAVATDDVAVAGVQFYVNGQPLGTLVTSFPYTIQWTPTSEGTYSLNARAFDSTGNQATSTTVSVTVKAASVAVPVVSITSPATGANVAVNVAQTVSANASVAGGSIASVQFLVDGVSLSTDSSYPYSATWTPSSPGVYSLTAVATDNSGSSTTSSKVTVTAVVGAAPTVTIVNPNAGGTYMASKEILFDATASDSDGTIAKVDFYANGVLVASDTNSPYYTNWTPSSPGTYSLVARATDNSGNMTDSGVVTITVTQNTPPAVTLKSPATASTFTLGSPIVFFAEATDANGTINHVRFVANGDLVGSNVTTAPYTTIWTPQFAGVYTVMAIGVDNDLNAATSGTSTVNVVAPVGIVPTVGITSPAATIPATTASTYPLTAGVIDPDGAVTSVAFYDNGVLLGTVGASPFSISWRPAKAGSHRLVAVATDSSGNVVSSTPVDISVTAGVSNAPAVSLTNPVSGSTLPANVSVQLSATATDSDGSVASVQFLANGTVLATDAAYPYAFAWTPAGTGRYVLTAVATDNTGNQTTSAPVSVEVVAAGSSTVAITSPASLSTIPVNTKQTIIATASSTSGTIASIEYIANNVSLGVVSAFPYAFDWTPTATGTYQMTAVATDTYGNKFTSVPITVTVAAGGSPTVTLSNPANGASIGVNTAVLLQATATDPDGTVTQVDFQLNGTSFYLDTTYPFSVEWKPATTGTFVITAVATDNAGNKVSSTAATVTVTGGTAPSVAITSPSVGDVPVNLLQHISVNAASSTGTISQVQVYVNGAALAADTSFPFSADWTPTSLGNVVLTAVATDNLGNQSTSAPITVRVVASAPPIVTLVQPATGSSYSVGTKLSITAEASDPDGMVQSVQFFINGVSQGVLVTSPYSVDWTPSSAGVYTLTAVAIDNSGNRTTSVASTVTIGANAAPTLALTNPQPGLSYSLGNSIVLSAKAADADGSVTGVRFFANGKEVGNVKASPYMVNWMPTVAGIYVIMAQATDDNGNVTATPGTTIAVTGASAPVVALTNPSQGASYGVDTAITLNATASGGNGAIAQVQFFVNGSPLGTADLVAPYSATWKPAAAGSYTVTAVATDNVGLSTTSSPLSVNVLANTAPMVALTNPSTAVRVSAGSVLTLAANASDVDGNVASVRFLANGFLIGSVTAAPYTLSWKPSAAGVYQIVAEAVDNSGNATSSLSVQATVVANANPTVSITSPNTGFSTRVGTGVTLKANAADADGTIAKVEFSANGVVLGSDDSAPYQFAWTPTAEGVYRLVAVATDNTGSSTVSEQVMVLVSGTGLGSADQVYTGVYQASSESGKFAYVSVQGRGGVFIGWSTTTPARTYYQPGIVPDAAGGIQVVDTKGATIVDARVSDTGLNGTFVTQSGQTAYLIGQISLTGTSTFPSGLWTGSISGRYASVVSGIVDRSGNIALALVDGTFSDAGTATLLSTGSFTLTTLAGTKVQGRLDPLTGFLTATLTGGPGGSILAAHSSGPSFSDGVLRNLSTRGQVGSGNKIMTAGFIVDGSTPKRILVRAIGPTLANYGISSGYLANPMLKLYSGSSEMATNDDWAGDNAIVAAQASVGAFALPATSRDAVLLTTLNPGSYTAQVSGVGGSTGIALVELYDLDTPDAYTAQKLVNVSTSGEVGAGANALFAGFIVNGQSSKKVLIRGIGPTLATYGVSGVLADPVLVLRTGTTVVRENDNWEVGNEAALVAAAAAKTGAFALPAGSKDAVLLINLPPAAYSVELRSAGTATGIAMVEVYEVP